MRLALVALVGAACASAPATISDRPAVPARIEGGRTGGETRVAAPPRLLSDLAGAGLADVELVFRVCLDETGYPWGVTLASPLGLPDEVVKVYIRAIKDWSFAAYSVNGEAIVGCDHVHFRQRRDARDAAGEMEGRPHLLVVYMPPRNRKLGRDPSQDVVLPAELAKLAWAQGMREADVTFLVCYDASGATDDVRLAGPATTPPELSDWFIRGLQPRRAPKPYLVHGLPVRACVPHVFHVLAN
jgi:hypothetical protein